MSTFYSGPALDSELTHRRSTLLLDAATHRLARQARQARRAGRTAARTPAPRPVVAQPAAAPVPAGASAGPAGPGRDQVSRAA